MSSSNITPLSSPRCELNEIEKEWLLMISFHARGGGAENKKSLGELASRAPITQNKDVLKVLEEIQEAASLHFSNLSKLLKGAESALGPKKISYQQPPERNKSPDFASFLYIGKT